MNDETKSGYVAGGIFLLSGILVSVVGFDSGWSNGKLIIIIGLFMSSLGVGSIWKPNTIGQLMDYYLQKLSENQENKSMGQSQKNTKESTQATAKNHSKVTVQNYYYKSALPEEKISDEKNELIREINKDITKEKLSNTLIKCIRLAKITNSKKDLFWLENEAHGFDENVRGQIKEEEIPLYRVINTEVRMASTAHTGYTPINYKLTLGHPIFQIEEWIESYEKIKTPGEMILTAPMTDIFKKVYREHFNEDIPEREIPYIVSISELKKVLNGLKLRITEFVSSLD